MHLLFDEILQHLKADKALAAQVSRNLRSTSFDLHAADNEDTWDLLADACEGVRQDKWRTSTAEQRFASLFEIFTVWPCYTTASHLYGEFIHGEAVDELAKRQLWHGILDCIGSDDLSIREAIEYVLWVDFFEDQSTCKETWGELTSRVRRPEVLDRLIVNAGPVPFALKQPFYRKLSRDPSRHAVLAESLARSIDDAFGQTDLVETQKYFDKLQLPDGNKHFEYLRKKLSETATKNPKR